MHVMNFDSNDRQVNLLLRWFFWGVAPLVLVSCNSEDPSSDVTLFTYNASDGIRSLDPGKATDLESMWVVDQLYEGLLELDAELQVQPALAESWSVSDDGLIYAFRLRSNARFHNGKRVTAADVAASFDRLRDARAIWPPFCSRYVVL